MKKKWGGGVWRVDCGGDGGLNHELHLRGYARCLQVTSHSPLGLQRGHSSLNISTHDYSANIRLMAAGQRMAWFMRVWGGVLDFDRAGTNAGARLRGAKSLSTSCECLLWPGSKIYRLDGRGRCELLTEYDVGGLSGHQRAHKHPRRVNAGYL